VAPGVGVFKYDSTGAITNVAIGTSAAAPFVTGIAGLLLSFDSRLTNAQLRQYIIEGAQRGNRSVTHGQSTYYVADAYESLKRAAEEPGAPVCGNRMWRAADSLMVQRGLSGDEKIFVRPGAQSPGTHVVTIHDGRFIDFGGLIRWVNGGWFNASGTPYPASPSGSYWGSTGRSHDGDSIISYQQISGNPNPVVEFRVGPVDGASTEFLTLPGFGSAWIYSPAGDQAVVFVKRAPGLAGSLTDAFSVEISTGQNQLLYTLPANVFPTASSISEDGSEIMSIYSTLSSSCVIEFRSFATGDTLRNRVTFPSDNCGGSGVFPAIRAAP
jgi:hypothetical protein